MSDFYEFKMSLIGHGDPEEFLLFIRNFNMTLAATGMLYMDVKIYYLRMLVPWEALPKFDLFSVDVETLPDRHVQSKTS